MRFKVGDKVRVREWDDMVKEGAFVDENGKLHFETTPCRFNSSMRQYCGKIATIKGFRNSEQSFYSLNVDDGDWSWVDEFLVSEPPSRNNHRTYKDTTPDAGFYSRIINGPATIVIITNNGKKYKGVAKCAPDDVFDVEKGHAIALRRAQMKQLQAELKELCK